MSISQKFDKSVWKEFDSSKFKNELKNALAKENIDSCTKFDE